MYTSEADDLIDYAECSYGASRLAFRGPRRPLDGPYSAILGGSETYGRFVREPFPDLVERDIGEPVANLGVMHAGLTLLLDDPAIMDIASRARVAVVQVLGAQNMSNRFYRVHPRRNDRFLGASDSLRALYPDVDFTEFHFTGHLLAALLDHDAHKFERVVKELRSAWLARMHYILGQLTGERVLLWISDRTPEERGTFVSGLPPYFVDREMIEALVPDVSGVVEVVPSSAARQSGLKNMVFEDTEAEAAGALPNPATHREIANAISSVIAPLPAAGNASWKVDRPARRVTRPSQAV